MFFDLLRITENIESVGDGASESVLCRSTCRIHVETKGFLTGGTWENEIIRDFDQLDC